MKITSQDRLECRDANQLPVFVENGSATLTVVERGRYLKQSPLIKIVETFYPTAADCDFAPSRVANGKHLISQLGWFGQGEVDWDGVNQIGGGKHAKVMLDIGERRPRRPSTAIANDFDGACIPGYMAGRNQLACRDEDGRAIYHDPGGIEGPNSEDRVDRKGRQAWVRVGGPGASRR